MTLISRISGFIRDTVVALYFGADAHTDAFFVAFKIPNFLRRLFAEGSFSQAFVPVLSDYKQNYSPSDLKIFLNRTAGTLAIVLLLITIIGMLAAPLLIFLFAPGFYRQGVQYELSVDMLRITFPYLLFISLTAFSAGILNTFGRFAVPAFTPVFLNLCMITAAIWLAPYMPVPITALAWGVFAAGIVQMLFQFPTLIKAGLLPRLRCGFYDAGVRRIMRLMVPAIFGVSITQINLLVDTLIASFLISGSVSWLYYSDRLVEFPLGIFGVAIGTVILPHLSKSHASKDQEAFSNSLDWALRWVLLIGLPSTVGLVLLAQPLLSTLFQYKQFAWHDVEMASRSLMTYSVGLLAFIAVKVLVPGFSSRQDLRTPVRYGMYAVAANIFFNLALVFKLSQIGWGHAGLALATALAAFFNAGLLLRRLLRDGIYRPENGWAGYLTRIFWANLAMGLLLVGAVDRSLWQSWDVVHRAFNLLLWIAAAALVYLICLRLSGLRRSHLALKD
jgi:putative peptidoglycan lipid II flippase